MGSNSDKRRLRETVAESPPFCLLTRELIDELFSRMEVRDFAAGDFLIQQGVVADGLMVLVDGRVEVRVTDHQGVTHSIAELGSGDVIGEMALLTKEPRSADVIASTAVQALYLSSDHFNQLATSHPEVTVVLTEILAERLGTGGQDSLGGKIIEGYRILRCLGRGGMAVVYETLDEAADGERVALKMMNHRLLFHAGAAARFQREADILMRLNHKNITRVTRCFSAFRTSFLAMEFCDGRGLIDFIESHGAQPESAVRAFLGQLSGALGYLHDEKLIHRDLKPGNVLLTKRGEIKLADFGLARRWTASPTSVSLTTTGTVVGTPLYMAPEQILGNEATPNCDVYAFGCVGLELLLGRVPFQASDLPGLIDEKRTFQLPAAKDIGTGISDELHAVLAGCLAQKSEERTFDRELISSWAAPFGAS